MSWYLQETIDDGTPVNTAYDHLSEVFEAAKAKYNLTDAEMLEWSGGLTGTADATCFLRNERDNVTGNPGTHKIFLYFYQQ